MAFEIPNKNRKKEQVCGMVRMHGDVFEYFKMYLKSSFLNNNFHILKGCFVFYVTLYYAVEYYFHKCIDVSSTNILMNISELEMEKSASVLKRSFKKFG